MATRGAGIVLFLMMAACGSDPFDGTFEATYEGRSATFRLEEEDGRLSGTVAYSGVDGTVEGKVDDETAEGNVTVPSLGVVTPFKATARDDRIDWVYTLRNPATGATQEVRLELRRAEGGDDPKPSGSPNLDPRLIGTWYSEVSSGQLTGNLVTTRITNTFHADGSFTYGGATSLMTLHDRPGDAGETGGAGPGGNVTGKWKTESDVLYGMRDGVGQWVLLGRYAVSGNDLIIYGADGSKQLWSR
jgi:hypothetical protein